MRLVLHAVGGLFAIDLICGPGRLAVESTATIANAVDGDVMSDYAGYVVEGRFP